MTRVITEVSSFSFSRSSNGHAAVISNEHLVRAIEYLIGHGHGNELLSLLFGWN